MNTNLTSLALVLLLMTGASAQNTNWNELAKRAIERRAFEAVIWGMPAVNAELLFEAVKDAKADFNQASPSMARAPIV